MSDIKTITLPYPPSANRFYRVYNNRAVMSGEARAYKQEAALRARVAGARKIVGPVRISLDFYRPRQQGDLDNRLKILIDAMSGILYDDDEQITEIHARRFEDKGDPRVEISVSAAP